MDDNYVPFIREDLLHPDRELLKAKGVELRGTPVEDILGIGRADPNQPPPTDEENKEAYINYLIEKYK